MYYELIILSLLMGAPWHGYNIARVVNDIIGPYARASNGRIYPLLAKLEAQNLIVACEEGKHDGRERQPRHFRITAAGRERFRELMLDTSSNPGEYQKFFARKVPTLRFLEPEERLYIIEHYLNFCNAHILHLKSEIENPKFQTADPRAKEMVINVMQHTLAQWQLELDWAQALYRRALS